MLEFPERIEAAVAALKAKLKGTHEAPNPDAASGVAELERAARDLEADLADVLKEVVLEARRAGELETRAMEAIRNGDDSLAREALQAHQVSVDTLQKLDADATVLRAMIAECRAVLDQAGE